LASREMILEDFTSISIEMAWESLNYCSMYALASK